MMKKVMAAVLSFGLAAMVLSGCGNANWKKKVTLNDLGGKVVASTNGGFSVEKGDYLYFINGSGTYTDSNKFGTPVKSALMVAKKNDLATAEIVVPKLFAAADYNAGIYIFGDYVYYATPTTEKDNKGEIASDYLDICKSKLDGSETSRLTRIHGNAAKYKIAEVDGVVYCIYYNQDNKGVETYNEKTGKTTVIAKNVTSYFFSNDYNTAKVVYTMAVADETKLDSDDTEKVMAYNEVYVVTAAETEGKKVLDGAGKNNGNTAADANLEGYKFTLVDYYGEFILYSRQAVNNTDYTEYFVTTAADMIANVKAQTVKEASIMAATSIVLGKTDFISSATINSKTYLARYTVKADGTVTKVPMVETTATLVKADETDVYFYNSDSILSRVALNLTYGKKTDIVTFGIEKANTSWYAPELYTIDGKEHVFFNNADTLGYNYIFDMDLSKEKEVEKDDDGKVTKEYWTSEFVGVMTDADAAAKVTALITSKLPTSAFDYTEGSDDMVALQTVKTAYDKLTKAQKKLVTEDTYAKITDIDEAIAVSKKIDALTYTTETIAKENKAEIKAILTEYKELSANAQGMIKKNTLNKLYALDNVIISNKW